jgi:predicted ArsR family transcriptional regulator
MTPTQSRIHKYILSFHKKTGEVPTCDTTAQHFGISRQAMNGHYNKLLEHGVIKRKEIVSHYTLV